MPADIRAGALLIHELSAAPRRYRLTVVINASPDTLDVLEQTTAAGSGQDAARPLGLAWPPTEASAGLRLDALEPRGEKQWLLVPVEQFMRLSYNPFHPCLEERLRGWLAP